MIASAAVCGGGVCVCVLMALFPSRARRAESLITIAPTGQNSHVWIGGSDKRSTGVPSAWPVRRNLVAGHHFLATLGRHRQRSDHHILSAFGQVFHTDLSVIS